VYACCSEELLVWTDVLNDFPVFLCRLHAVLRPFMLRRLKESVATELPQKVGDSKFCLFSAQHQMLVVLLVMLRLVIGRWSHYWIAVIPV
jgi:hypothetical protein